MHLLNAMYIKSHWSILEMFTYRLPFYPNLMRYGLYTIFINHVISPLLSWLRERHISVMVLAAKQCFSYVHPNVWFKILFLDNQFHSCLTKLFQNEYKFSTRFCWNKEKTRNVTKESFDVLKRFSNTKGSSASSQNEEKCKFFARLPQIT